MDASVWVGAAFGLVGTGVGGGLSIWSSAIAQRQQAVRAREERQQVLASTAVEAALAELLEVQRDARRAGPLDEARQLLLHERVLHVQVLMQRVPDAALRSRVRENTLLMPLSPPEDTRTSQERRVDIMLLCADAIACLGAYLRAEPPPPPVERLQTLRRLWPFDGIAPEESVFMYEADS
ncbi:hypothetical protein JCM4814A_81940 [Streptomyces phaeofaciens JCM 4814]|uniref:Uncharacterized protein n=1 Tax=Streptomyces phaeofaciens TaxID=68254 RepID=A0A918HNY1_9ACTN|nr:hypothetical protein [Streptomyces phaeofaciens]GGT89763.1 hypothetical protein GCM10010226_79960 [Streptomyces phaeofaciens]